MEFYQLEAFVMVVAHRSFSRAAQHLFLSQPTVSAHVKSLETEICMPLFDRGKSELLLTPAGETLYRYARDMLDMRTTVLTELSCADTMPEESITIAASSVPCQYLLPGAVVAFQQLYPTIKINIRQENSATACEDVFRYHYAVGIVGEKIKLPQLMYEPLVEDELVVAIPQLPAFADLVAKGCVTVEDMIMHPLLMREEGSGTRSLFEQALQGTGTDLAAFQMQVFDNQETIKQAVRRGLGLTVISRYVVEDYVQFGLLAARSVTGLDLKRNFFLVTHAKRIQSPATRAFTTFIRTFFPRGDLS
ncbi:MAG: selenium metabolism-associated LysR family transcriptional regulator [Firmicutes bacterium]|nr:selenium metabolism-associated LysR family transcriptional regulator [Bacillota bacterium]